MKNLFEHFKQHIILGMIKSFIGVILIVLIYLIFSK